MKPKLTAHQQQERHWRDVVVAKRWLIFHGATRSAIRQFRDLRKASGAPIHNLHYYLIDMKGRVGFGARSGEVAMKTSLIILTVTVLIVGALAVMNNACKSGQHAWCAPMSTVRNHIKPSTSGGGSLVFG